MGAGRDASAGRAGGHRQALGAHGEKLAAAWYAERGYELVARNWRTRTGEIDLVLRKGPVCVFCEVKTRSSSAFGAPIEAVTAQKQRRLRRLAAEWLAQRDAAAPPGARREWMELRFDVASVTQNGVEVVEAAF